MSCKVRWFLITSQEIDRIRLNLGTLEKRTSGEDRECCVEIENVLHTLEERLV